jgi:hypothetical protein
MTIPDYVDHADEWFEVFDQFEGDGALDILRTYLKLHEGKIGAHWLWCALERIAQGEKEFDVLWDYGYVYSDEVIEMKEGIENA